MIKFRLDLFYIKKNVILTELFILFKDSINHTVDTILFRPTELMLSSYFNLLFCSSSPSINSFIELELIYFIFGFIPTVGEWKMTN
jgi:hypothetical protein